MKSAKVLYKIAYLLIVVLVAVFTVGYAFAWFFDRKDAEFTISGKSAGAYFESGDGSADKPFIISNPTHMHNLAVLQNMGKLDTKYYFEIKDSLTEPIDMTGHYIPPIGNDAHPFVGDFDGNGKALANLNVTTNKDFLRSEYPNHARDTYEFSQAVGLFGMTGADSNIHNLILDNPTVDVSANNTLYLTTAKDGVSPAAKAAGIAVGFVAGKVSSVGVRAANAALNVNMTGYSSFNSILGELAQGVDSSVTGGGHGQSGSGAAFGSSFDVDGLRTRMDNIYKNNGASKFLPPVEYDSSSHRYNLKNRAKLAFSVDSSASKYTGANAREVVSDQNIGYVLGNQTKIYDTTLTFAAPLSYDANVNNGQYYTRKTTGSDGKINYITPTSSTVPSWLYKNVNLWSDDIYNTNNQTYTSGAGFSALTEEEFNALPQNVKDVIPAKDNNGNYTSATFATIRLSEEYKYQKHAGSNGEVPADSNSTWSYHGQISWMGKTYGEGFRNPADGKLMDKDGNYLDSNGNIVDSATKAAKFYEYNKGIALPNTAIWFKPAQPGKIRFIMYAESSGEGFVLIKVTRENATAENPFYLDPAKKGADAVYSTVMLQQMPSNVLLYYEYDVTEDVAAGNVDYLLMQTGSGGAYFVYLDVGANATQDTSTVTTDAVSAVDFIYDGVEIEQTDEIIGVGNFIVSVSGEKALYESSKTSVWFENITKVLNMVYLRLNGNTSGATGAHTDHNGKTICLVGSTEGADKTAISTTSEVKATRTAYVCPTISGGSGTAIPGGDTTKPSISGTSSLTVGGTTQLTAKNISGTVTWSSSDESVATVNDSGLVTAVSEGTVTITATNGTTSASITITVTAATVAEYTVSFDLNGGSGTINSQTVNEGGKATKPADPTRTGYTFGGWFKEAACTNEYNFDTAVSGDLTLYAKWTAATVAVESVSLNKTTLSLTVGGSETLSATVSPSGATNKDVTWSSDKPSVATVDSNGKVTAVGEGTATITVTTADGNKTAQCTVTVNAAAYTTGTHTMTFSADNDIFTGTKSSADGGYNGSYFKLGSGDYLNINMKLHAGDTVKISGKALPANTARNASFKVTAATGGVNGLSTDAVAVNASSNATAFEFTCVATNEGDVVLRLERVATTTGCNITELIVEINPTETETPTVSYVTITQGETASVAYGGSLKLDATVTMSDNTTNNNVTWSSGNTSVATVDSNGNITTNGVGTAVITATSTADNTQSASITITVTGFTVSYVINDHGTQPADVTNVIKLPATLPTLTETGYTFDGWFTDSALTTAATAGAAISGNTTLYAKWTASGGTTVYLEKGTHLAKDFSASQTLEQDGIKLNNSFNTSSTNNAKWSGTINGTETEYATGIRAGGSSRSIAVNLKAGTKIILAIGGDYANTNEGTITLSDKLSGGKSLATATLKNTNNVANGLIEYDVTQDGTYYIIFGANKPSIYAIVVI